MYFVQISRSLSDRLSIPSTKLTAANHYSVHDPNNLIWFDNRGICPEGDRGGMANTLGSGV